MATPDCLPVTVVIPCWRCSATIGRALDSVRVQTAQPAEIILVDDASGDGTAGLLRGLSADYPAPTRVQVVELPANGGAATARNAGWAAATQDFVAFLDADDSWHPRKLEIQHALMQRCPQAPVSGHLHLVTPGSIAETRVEEMPKVASFGFHDLLWRNRFVTSSAMVRRAQAARFPAGQRYMEDHRLWLEIASAGVRLLRIESPLAAHHKADFGAGGLSGNMPEMEKAELGNYMHLRALGVVGYPLLLALLMWSLLKFLRRIVIVKLRGK